MCCVAPATTEKVYNYGVELAPVIFGPSTGEVPGLPNVEGQEGIDGLRQFGRYVAYDTILCYMYPPPGDEKGGPVGDGTVVELHYSNRGCFPMIPYLPPDMKKFNDAFNLGTEFDWNELEYDNACDSAAVKALIGPMMGDLTSVGFIAGPYGSLLRFAEGIDSMRNLAKTGDTNLTESQRGAAIVCSIAQLGGILWMATSVLFLAVFCMTAPIGSWCCLRCYRICRGASQRDSRREEALDDLIAQQYGDIGNAPSQTRRKRVGKRRVHATGHLLLGEVQNVE